MDSSGNAYVTGITNSTEATFPDTVGPDLSFNGGANDAFVTKVKADGTGLIYCGFIGGSGNDEGRGIAVDSSGNAYVTGITNSTETTFPDTVGPDLSFNGGANDAFVTKVKADGTDLAYCGFIGGAATDGGFGIAVDGNGNAYVTGNTFSTTGTLFPVKDGPFLINNGMGDAFVAKVQADGKDLSYCGFIGGGDADYGMGIAVDGNGSAYVVGYTSSSDGLFPKAVGPYLSHNGGSDSFVAKVKADGKGLTYCGFIGGTGNDYGFGIAVDSGGNAYVTGRTDSTETTKFPVAAGPDLSQNGGIDAFVAKVQANGNSLIYSGFIGGAKGEDGQGIAVDSNGNAYVTGSTGSTQSFPVSVGPNLIANGNVDAFIAKIREDDFPWPAFLPAIMEGGKKK